MRIEIPPAGAAIVFTVLIMGVVGIAVVLPIACIQWTWNSVVSPTGFLPMINAFQATLLYLAIGTILYLTGFIHIEFGSGAPSE